MINSEAFFDAMQIYRTGQQAAAIGENLKSSVGNVKPPQPKKGALTQKGDGSLYVACAVNLPMKIILQVNNISFLCGLLIHDIHSHEFPSIIKMIMIIFTNNIFKKEEGKKTMGTRA